MVAKVGDRLILETERLGEHPREGVVLEVLGKRSAVHYRVRWEDDHESFYFPSASGGFQVVRAPKPEVAVAGGR